MIVIGHYPRAAKRRANVPVDLGSTNHVPRHRACRDERGKVKHFDVADRIGHLLAWRCVGCDRTEVA